MTKTWLITGCSSGLGRALAETLLAKGYQVAVTARNPEKVQDLVNQYPNTAIALALDVTDRDSIWKAVTQTVKHFGTIDVLVNNAGYCLRGAVEECTIEEIQKQFATNFFGPVNMIQEVLPFMREKKSGVIVNYSSVAALRTSEGSAYYGASKAALEGMSDGLRKEVGPLGIKVMVVEPGPFPTDFYDRSLDVNNHNISDYAETADKRKVRIENMNESPIKWGSKEKAAEAVITAIESDDTPFRLLLGKEAIAAAESLIAEKQEEIHKWRRVIESTDESQA